MGTDATFPLLKDVVMQGRYVHQLMRIPSRSDKELVAQALERANLADLADVHLPNSAIKKACFCTRIAISC